MLDPYLSLILRYTHLRSSTVPKWRLGWQQTTNLTMLEYASYRLASREEFSMLHRSGS